MRRDFAGHSGHTGSSLFAPAVMEAQPMCRHATLALPPDPASAGAARRFLRTVVGDWELAVLLDVGLLALTELVTNAILHAATPLSVSVSVASSAVEMAVFDGSPVMPVTRRLDDATSAGPDSTDVRMHVRDAGAAARGRGLFMVDALASEWGVSPLSDGKAVWIRIPAPDPWPHGVGCPCADGAVTGRVQLASGQFVLPRG